MNELIEAAIKARLQEACDRMHQKVTAPVSVVAWEEMMEGKVAQCKKSVSIARLFNFGLCMESDTRVEEQEENHKRNMAKALLECKRSVEEARKLNKLNRQVMALTKKNKPADKKK